MAEKKLTMKTERFDIDGKQAIVGVLRKFNAQEPLYDLAGIDVNKRIISIRERGFEGGVPLWELPKLINAVNTFYGTSLSIISHGIADYLLAKIIRGMGHDDSLRLQAIGDAFPCRVSQCLAYEKPGVRLAQEIVFISEDEPRVILPTGRYKGELGIALVVPELAAMDIKRDGNDLLVDVPDSRLQVVPAFPSKDGYHMTYKDTCIPYGDEVDRALKGARNIWVLKDFSYVGLPVRGIYYSGYGAVITVIADCMPSCGLPVAVEVPEWDIGRIEEPATGTSNEKTTGKIVQDVLTDAIEDLAKKSGTN